MKITVFQALTKLLKDKQVPQPWLKKLQRIYLNGIDSTEDKLFVSTLLRSPILQEYDITEDLTEVVKDPTRRFFESTLMINQLATTLDALELPALLTLSKLEFDKMDKKYKVLVPRTLYLNKDLHLLAGQNLGEEEYAAILQSLKDPDGYLFLLPTSGNHKDCETLYLERKLKLELIVKCAFCAVVAVQLNNDGYPIPIYQAKDSLFSKDKRGRAFKGVPDSSDLRDKQIVRSMTLGIMASFMPVYGPLKAKAPSSYVKPTDKSKPVLGSAWIEKIQDRKVIPFVNSLSGTLLMQLRLSKKLLDDGTYTYSDAPKQLALFYKAFVASMLYSSGGHCLFEFMQVFELPKVKEAFKSLPGFDGLSTSSLFLDDSASAFMKSVDSTVEYNEVILNKKALAEALTHK
jgi:hypothetical protein